MSKVSDLCDAHRGCTYPMCTGLDRGGYCRLPTEPGTDRCSAHARLDCVPVGLIVPRPDPKTTTCPCCTGRIGLPPRWGQR